MGLFPKNDDIDLIERMTLSIGLSIVIVPLIGLGLNFTPWGIRLDPIVISVTLFTLVMLLILFYRRTLVPSEERFSFLFPKLGVLSVTRFFQPGAAPGERILGTVIILSILIATITTIYVITVPKDRE